MRPTSTYKYLALPVLLVTLLLRAAIPDGYMPAAASSGLFAELCPTGMPFGFMQAISGADGGHHHGSHDDGSSHYNSDHCPIGHLLSGAVAVDIPQWASEPPAPAPRAATPAASPVFIYRGVHHSRDPPA